MGPKAYPLSRTSWLSKPMIMGAKCWNSEAKVRVARDFTVGLTFELGFEE